MKVCIDGLGISKLHGTGLYSYTYELLDNLFQIYPQPHYNLVWDDSPPVKSWSNHKNIDYVKLELNRIKNDYSSLEEYMESRNIKLYHSPNNGLSIPGHKVTKYIMTVHDLMPLSHKEYVDSKYSEKFIKMFPHAVVKCDKIIATSHFIKNEILRYFPVSNEKIIEIYPGCSMRFIPMEIQKCKNILKEKYNITNDYLLYAGSIHPRKNIPILLRAFKIISGQLDKDLKLVIAGRYDGKRREYYLKLKSICRQLSIEDSVIFTGTIEYEDMPYLYNGAWCFINLSSYEGFPMSTIESMACGTPVICSKFSSFKETAADGAVYAGPENEEVLSELILKIINDKNYRKSIIEKGKEQSKKYNWDTSIKKLISVYESIAYDN